MTGTHNNKAGNYRVLTILSLLSTCGAAVYFIAPLLVGGYVTQLGFSSQQGRLHHLGGTGGFCRGRDTGSNLG